MASNISLYLYPYHSAQYILFPRHLWIFMFPSAPYPLLPNFCPFFRTHPSHQQILLVTPLHALHWSYRTRATGTLCLHLPHSSHSGIFSKKQNTPLSSFQWLFHVLSRPAGSVCLGPHLLLHDSYVFSLDDLLVLGMCLASLVLSKPLSLPCPLHGVMLCPQLLPQQLSSPCLHCNVTASNLPIPSNLTWSTCVLSHHPISFRATNL